MAYRITDDYEPGDIPFDDWESCELRGYIAHPRRHIETDENHEEDDDEAI